MYRELPSLLEAGKADVVQAWVVYHRAALTVARRSLCCAHRVPGLWETSFQKISMIMT